MADTLDFEEPVAVLLKEIEALRMMPQTPERQASIARLESAPPATAARSSSQAQPTRSSQMTFFLTSPSRISARTGSRTSSARSGSFSSSSPTCLAPSRLRGRPPWTSRLRARRRSAHAQPLPASPMSRRGGYGSSSPTTQFSYARASCCCSQRPASLTGGGARSFALSRSLIRASRAACWSASRFSSAETLALYSSNALRSAAFLRFASAHGIAYDDRQG